MKGHKHGQNRWLDWKIKHGLAARGHVGGIKCPKGLVAGLLYKLFYAKNAPPRPDQTTGGIVFEKSVGGGIGPSGNMNGD